jgi:hypothetical protein
LFEEKYEREKERREKYRRDSEFLLFGMQRKREERLKICGAHCLLFSPQNNEEMGEREKCLIFVVPFLPLYSNFIYDLLSFLQIANMKDETKRRCWRPAEGIICR